LLKKALSQLFEKALILFFSKSL